VNNSDTKIQSEFFERLKWLRRRRLLIFLLYLPVIEGVKKGSDGVKDGVKRWGHPLAGPVSTGKLLPILMQA